ncbi:MAG: KH domain-containing protein [Lentisphaeria bacterium]|nr:KH domain-containing protein [Lentisphaeria bacterium]
MGFWSKLFGGGSSEPAATETTKNTRPDKTASSGRSSSPACARSVSMTDLESFVEFVAKALVDYPDEVKVSTRENEDGKTIRIFCRAGDRGKIIGKKGKTIMALRSLVAGAAGRSRSRVSVEVPDDNEEEKG